MELLNPAFVILCVKIAFCVLPGVIGIYLISLSEEKKRELRNSLCNRLFGVSNAIPFPSFERALLVIGLLAIVFCLIASWFLLISGLVSGS